jgi:hypothetical protein
MTQPAPQQPKTASNNLDQPTAKTDTLKRLATHHAKAIVCGVDHEAVVPKARFVLCFVKGRNQRAQGEVELGAAKLVFVIGSTRSHPREFETVRSVIGNRTLLEEIGATVALPHHHR